jgi:hypothetical protein
VRVARIQRAVPGRATSRPPLCAQDERTTSGQRRIRTATPSQPDLPSQYRQPSTQQAKSRSAAAGKADRGAAGTGSVVTFRHQAGHLRRHVLAADGHISMTAKSRRLRLPTPDRHIRVCRAGYPARVVGGEWMCRICPLQIGLCTRMLRQPPSAHQISGPGRKWLDTPLTDRKGTLLSQPRAPALDR